MSKVLALIPARSGSKTVKDKNIRNIAGKPLLAYSIEHAISAGIERIIVSTDSREYAEIAKKYGAEAPFLRPSEYSQDLSHDIEAFAHALKWLREHESYEPDLIIHLRPTCPIREPNDITKMVDIINNDASMDCIRSILPSKENPYKMWTIGKDNKISPVSNTIPNAFSMTRQSLPDTYIHDSSIDVLRPRNIDNGTMHGDNIYGYISSIKEMFDIDDIQDFHRAETYLRIIAGDCTICFDIDGVIAHLTTDNNYVNSKPNKDIINTLNMFYDYGNNIILNTARGYITGIDWTDVTKDHLAKWGVKYHKLLLGKPAADVYFDDRMASLDLLDIFREAHCNDK